jgi:hypothetical protein
MRCCTPRQPNAPCCANWHHGKPNGISRIERANPESCTFDRFSASSLIETCNTLYKDIEQVMAAQTDLLEPLGRFLPRIVKMAPAGERAED